MSNKASLAQAVSVAFRREPLDSPKGQMCSEGSMPGYLPPSQKARSHEISSSQSGVGGFIGVNPGFHGFSQPHGVVGRESRSTGWNDVERSLPRFQDGGGELGFEGMMSSRGSFEPGMGHPGVS